MNLPRGCCLIVMGTYYISLLQNTSIIWEEVKLETSFWEFNLTCWIICYYGKSVYIISHDQDLFVDLMVYSECWFNFISFSATWNVSTWVIFLNTRIESLIFLNFVVILSKFLSICLDMFSLVIFRLSSSIFFSHIFDHVCCI